jgi:predicted enzyme related to lactoylglutathione lyase
VLYVASSSSSSAAVTHRVVALDVELTRRHYRSAYGVTLASDADAMVAKTKAAFEHHRVDVSGVLTHDDGTGARARADLGGSIGARDIEWRGEVIDVKATYADVLENIIEAFGVYAERLRESCGVSDSAGTSAAAEAAQDGTSREEKGKNKKKNQNKMDDGDDAKDGAKRVKTEMKRTPMSSPVKWSSSVGHWIADKRDRPKLRALADADK